MSTCATYNKAHLLDSVDFDWAKCGFCLVAIVNCVVFKSVEETIIM